VAISSGLYSVVETLLRWGADVSAAEQVRAIVLVGITYSDLSVSVYISFVTIYLASLKIQIFVPEDIRTLLDKTKEV
jgi:hypothetical protein